MCLGVCRCIPENLGELLHRFLVLLSIERIFRHSEGGEQIVGIRSARCQKELTRLLLIAYALQSLGLKNIGKRALGIERKR